MMVSLVLMASCKRTDQQAHVSKTHENCADPRTFNTDYALAEKCGHLGPVRSFSGTMALGFEISAFREGRKLDPSITKPGKNDYHLLLPETYEAKMDMGANGIPAISYAEFQGRTADVPASAGERALLVMKFIRIRPTELR